MFSRLHFRFLRAQATCGILACLLLLATSVLGPAQGAEGSAAGQLDAHRLIGEAHYENGDYKAAADEFGRCVELAPQCAQDRFNLALVQARARNHEQALAVLGEAEKLAPDLLNVHYLRGIVYKREGKFNEAVACFLRVLAADPQCWGTRYNLGVCYKSLNQDNPAKSAFEAATRVDPGHPSAYYQLVTLARRAGDVEAAKQYAEKFESVNATVDDAEKTPEALERSKYTRLIRLPRAARATASRGGNGLRFTDSTAAAGLQESAVKPPKPMKVPVRLQGGEYREAGLRNRYVPTVGSAVTLGDYDGDGDLDIYLVGCAADPAASANRLLANEGGVRFVDVTAEAGVGDRGLGLDAVFGDYDNDGDSDLYVVNDGPNVLYRNRGNRTFEEVSAAAHADEPQFGRQAAFVDYDHDNDLDLFIVNDTELAEPPKAGAFDFPDESYGQVNSLLRNNGNAAFTDQTDEAGLLVDCSQSRCVAFADFDGDFDTDLFVGNANAPSLLLANSRGGKFKAAGRFAPSLAEGTLAAEAGDFDRDGVLDLAVAVRRGLWIYVNAGQADFQGTAVPLPPHFGDTGVALVRAVDCDNDGRLDLLLVSGDGASLGLLAGNGDGNFQEVTGAAGLAGSPGWIADLDTGDLDGDGDEDVLLLTRDRGLRLLRNETARTTHWLNVKLQGKKVNRNGYGASVEISSGGHYQRQTACRGWLHFGLGDVPEIDVVRVTWPNGVAQNVIRPPLDAVLKIEEEIRVSASCAMLWADNGSGFEFINEVLGVGALGVPIAPGRYHQPDCTELTKIEARQLAARDGVYELRLTEELREITFADQFTLRAVDHPEGWEIVPNEMFTAPPFPADKFYAVQGPRPPRTALDDSGTDVLPLVRRRDGRWPAFPVTEYQGLAKPHAITLDFGDLSAAGQVLLGLDGWIYWPESSTVIAVAQDPRYEVRPLSLQVRDRAGQWQTVIESVGLPTSKGAVVPVDLTGCFLSDDYRVRLTTNLCVYFDRIFIATGDLAHRCRVHEMPVAGADLRSRGFSRMTRDPFGYERFDYGDVSQFGPWGPPAGSFTRYGDVTPLLAAADDQFVIFGPGDELALQFNARTLPPQPPGWVRDFIFYANGWVKDGDLNTALSERVEPLPFHGMPSYPYANQEHDPRSAVSQHLHRAFNTRPAAPSAGRLRGR